MRRMFTGFSLLAGLVLLLCTLGIRRSSSPNVRIEGVRINSTQGEELTSFFAGLPRDPKAWNKRSLFHRIEDSDIGLWFRGILGTTVHAQANCDGCYGSTSSFPCGTCRGGYSYPQQQEHGDICSLG